MATVRFTSALKRFLAAPPAEVAGATVGEALAAVFEARPALRGYVLDDQGALRRHVGVYIAGEAVRDRVKLSDPIGVEGADAWQELAAPAFPPKSEEAADGPHPWSVGKIWVIEAGGVPGRLWAGTMPGGLFRSDDGGESWLLNEPLWFMPERRQWQG